MVLNNGITHCASVMKTEFTRTACRREVNAYDRERERERWDGLKQRIGQDFFSLDFGVLFFFVH